MKDFSQDLGLKTESEADISIDNILAEYKLDESASGYYDEADKSGYSSFSYYGDEDDDVRVYTPGSSVQGRQDAEAYPGNYAESAKGSYSDNTPGYGGYDDGAQQYDYDAGYDDGAQQYGSDAGYDDGAQQYGGDGGYDDGAQQYGYDGGYDGGAQQYDYDGGYDGGAQQYDYDGGYDGGAQQYGGDDAQDYGTDGYAGPQRSSAIGALKDEARRYIAQLQAGSKHKKKKKDIYGDAAALAEEEYREQEEARLREAYDGYSGQDVPTEYGAPTEYDSAPDGSYEPDYGDGYEYTGDAYEDDTYAGADFEPGSEYDDMPGYDADPTSYSAEAGKSVYTSVSGEEPEIDSRFNLSGKRPQDQMKYAGSAVDLSEDNGYTPTRQTGYSPSQWTPDYDDPSRGSDEEEEAPRRKSFKFGKKRKKKAAAAQEGPAGDGDGISGFDDNELGPSDYAGDGDYENGGSRYDSEDTYFPPSFGEYVLSIFASLFLRMKGSAGKVTGETMSDTEEDLGAEVTPAAAAKYYGSFVKPLRLRLRISCVLLFILCWISLQLPVPGMLKHLPVAAAACFALQSAIMLLALDVVTTAILNAVRLRIGADTLAVFTCLLTGADALIVALSDSAALHMPLCALSSLSVVGLLLASFFSVKGLRKAMRVPTIGRNFYSVTGEIKTEKRELTLLKSQRSAAGFVRRAEEAPPDETASIKAAPVIALFALIFAVTVAAVTNSYSDFIYIYSALLAPTVPFAALSAFALPYFLGSVRVFKVGGAIAGWSGLCDIGASRNLIVTDRDLFPDGSVSLGDVRIFADEDANKVISYAGSMVTAIGSCAVSCFGKLLKDNNCRIKHVENFECLPGGGARGTIDGNTVLCGSTDLMRLMNVRIPYRLTDKTSVLLAINGTLYGIFSVNYEPLPQVRAALQALVRSNRHPVFAIRDFNVNPEMLHNTFDLATDGYDFPPYVERFGLSEPSTGKDSRIAAVICNEGLGPLTEVTDAGRRIYMAARINLLVNALSSVIGLMSVFIRFLSQGCVSLGFILLYMLLWALPVGIVSMYVNTK